MTYSCDSLISSYKIDMLANCEAIAHRIQLVESCFDSSEQPLAVPGRALLAEGVFTKRGRKRATVIKFFLFNDIIIYTNILMNKEKYNKQHIIPLEAVVKLESLEDDGYFENGWVIHTSTKSFAVFATISTEKQKWMELITYCIENLRRRSEKKAAEENVAVCVQDGTIHCGHDADEKDCAAVAAVQDQDQGQASSQHECMPHGSSVGRVRSE